MSATATIWLIWSCMWAAFWAVAGFFTLGIGWLGIPISLALGGVPAALERSRRPRQTTIIMPPQPPYQPPHRPPYRQVPPRPLPPPPPQPYDPWR